MELGSSLPHSQESATCPYPSQINPFLCPSHFRQTQLVSPPGRAKDLSAPGNGLAGSHIGNISYSHLGDDLLGVVTWDSYLETLMDFFYLSKNAGAVTVSILSYKPATMRRQVGWMVKHSYLVLGGGDLGSSGLNLGVVMIYCYRFLVGFLILPIPFDVTQPLRRKVSPTALWRRMDNGVFYLGTKRVVSSMHRPIYLPVPIV